MTANVGIDLHRRRSVIVRMTEAGEGWETVRIVNDVERLTSVMARAGQAPEVVLEASGCRSSTRASYPARSPGSPRRWSTPPSSFPPHHGATVVVAWFHHLRRLEADHDSDGVS
jgi:hypothetical protein